MPIVISRSCRSFRCPRKLLSEQQRLLPGDQYLRTRFIRHVFIIRITAFLHVLFTFLLSQYFFYGTANLFSVVGSCGGGGGGGRWYVAN